MKAGAIWRIAEEHRQSGELDAARTYYLALTRLPSAAGFGHLRLAHMSLAAGDLREAVHQLHQAHAAALADSSLLTQLCKQAFELGEARIGLDAARRLADLPGAGVQQLAETAKLLSDAMEPEDALVLLARARQAGLPDSTGAAYLEGLNCLYVGALERAFDALQRSTRLDPTFAPAYWSLAKLRRGEERSQRIDRLQALVARYPESHPDAPLLLYSLFHELDAEDDVAGAWPVLERAMRSRASQVVYNEASELALLRRLRAEMPSWAAAALQPGDPGEATSRPLMVIGMPRTGTTLIEQSLCKSWDIQGAGELWDFVQQMRWVANIPGPRHPDTALLDAIAPTQLQLLGSRYLEHTAWRAAGAAHYSDKCPENYMVAGHALAAMPSLKVLAVQRDAMDSCWSNLREWFGASYYYSYDVGHVARRYVAFSALLDAMREAFPGRVASVRYEDFVSSPVAESSRLAMEIGLRSRDDADTGRSVVPTASAVQVRGGVTTANIGAWRRYERWLAPLEAALGDARFSESARG